MKEIDVIFWAPDMLPVHAQHSLWGATDSPQTQPGVRYHHVNARLTETDDERREGMRVLPPDVGLLINQVKAGDIITMDGMDRAIDVAMLSPACGMRMCFATEAHGAKHSHAHLVELARMEPGDEPRVIPPGVYAVLEMPEGWASMLGIRIGDAVDGRVR